MARHSEILNDLEKAAEAGIEKHIRDLLAKEESPEVTRDQITSLLAELNAIEIRRHDILADIQNLGWRPERTNSGFARSGSSVPTSWEATHEGILNTLIGSTMMFERGGQVHKVIEKIKREIKEKEEKTNV